ncbi:MAG: response regulator transcription factor [Thermomicrobiales bacterium]
MLPLIEGLQILARAHQKQGHTEQARKSIEEAISIAARCQLSLVEAQSRIISYEIASASESGANGYREEIETLHQQLAELGATPSANRLEALLKKQSDNRPGNLTRRELEVLKLIVNGKTDNEIAESLFISPRTVSTHVGNMLGKAGVSNRVELTTWAHQNNILDGET